MPTRQSTRRIEDAVGTESSGAPARKMQRTVATSRKKAGKGKGRAELYYCLTQMPVDIFLSICSQLEPVDLLFLSRVSKGVRDFLSLKTSAHVWRSAYENLQPPHRPPPCPPEVNILHYTNFLFGVHCQFCGSRGTLTANNAGLVRLCSKCVNSQTISTRFMDKDIRELCHSDDYISILKVEYEMRQRERAQATSMPKYLRVREMARESRLELFTSLHTWQNELANVAIQEAARIRSQRQSSMQHRLSREVGTMPPNVWWQIQPLDFPHLREPYELTDDEWKNIRADVIDFVNDFLENQQINSFRTILTNRLDLLDDILQQFITTRPRISPTVLHVASLEPFSTLVKSSTSMDQTVNTALGQVSELPFHLTKWRQDTDKYLTDLIPQKGRSSVPRPLLELASTFFRCFACTEPISYPRILMHSCFLRPSGAKGGAGTKIQKKGRKPKNALVRQPRPMNVIHADTVFSSFSKVFGEGMHPDRDGVSYYREASTSARKVILACGENPDTITNTEMDRLDYRVECLLCSSSRRGRLVMRWTTAILHDLNKHGSEKRAPWRLVDSAQDLEQVEQEEKVVKDYTAQYFCHICDEKVQDRVAHLINSHLWGGHETNVLEQFYKDIDLTMTLPPLAVKI